MPLPIFTFSGESLSLRCHNESRFAIRTAASRLSTLNWPSRLILADTARVGRPLAGQDRAQPDRLQLAQPGLPFGLVDGALARRAATFGPLQRVVIGAAFDADDECYFAVLVGAGLDPAAACHRDIPILIAEFGGSEPF